ncbi:IS3 family transposase [Streptomyces sp. NPDC006134]|uniref:IS3 family transposase n=1 Tax=Streptomyces sp. NPDC006134 TaxID=3154467 RepID=UPI003404929E
MPKPCPEEFRLGVVRVARNRGPGVAVEQVATGFGVRPMTLWKWMRRADIDDGTKPGTISQESTGLRGARRRIKLLGQENEVLRRAVACLSQARPPKRIYPLVEEPAGDGVPVAVARRVLKFAGQPCCRRLDQPVADAVLEEAYRANALFDAHRDGPEFGYRFLADEARGAGAVMADRTAWRICRDNRWWSVFGKKRGKGKKAGPPVHDDLVRRDFTAAGPNRLWLAGLTEHVTGEGKLYLCAVKDVFSNRIVGCSIDGRMKSRLVVTALDNAVSRRGGVDGCLLHSDRGSQFRSRKSVRALDRHQMAGATGRVGAAGDNAAMESFFSLLRKNVLDRRIGTTREELRIAIVTWIERTCHRRRRQAALGRLTPVEFETVMTAPALQAA